MKRPTATYYALQRLSGADWETIKLFALEQFAIAYAATLGPEYRVEKVRR